MLVIAVPNFAGLNVKILGVKDGLIAEPEHINWFTVSSFKSLQDNLRFTILSHFSKSNITTPIIARRLEKIGVPRTFSNLMASIVYFGMKLVDMAGSGRYVYVFLKKRTG